MAKVIEVVFEGHKCLKFDNGVICGKSKMRAVLGNAEFCQKWLDANTKPIDNSLMSLVEALKKAGYKVSK